MGNYNDVLLEQLAQTGNGRYAYINNRNEVRVAFVDDFISSTQMLARDVKIQVEFNPKLVQSYRLLGYENRDVPDHRFRDDRQDGGEIGAGTEVTALYELIMSNRRGNGKLATITIRWKNAAETNVSELVREVKWNRHGTSFDQARPEMRLAIVAGRLAEKLKRTQYAASTSYEDLYRLAVRLRQDIPGEQTDELFDMIRRAGNLTRWHAYDDDDEVFGNYKR
jgi:Ca-activated chloride channel family protein